MTLKYKRIMVFVSFSSLWQQYENNYNIWSMKTVCKCLRLRSWFTQVLEVTQTLFQFFGPVVWIQYCKLISVVFSEIHAYLLEWKGYCLHFQLLNIFLALEASLCQWNNVSNKWQLLKWSIGIKMQRGERRKTGVLK